MCFDISFESRSRTKLGFESSRGECSNTFGHFFPKACRHTLKCTLKACADWRYKVLQLWRSLSRGYEVRNWAPCPRIARSYWFVVSRLPALAWRGCRRSFRHWHFARHWHMWDSNIFKCKKMCILCAGFCRWRPGGAVWFQTVSVSLWNWCSVPCHWRSHGWRFLFRIGMSLAAAPSSFLVTCLPDLQIFEPA